MVKKKQSAAERDVRLKAAAMREAQAKAEKRTRNIIIGVVSVLILAIVAAIIYIIASKPGRGGAADGVPAEFDAGQGISISADGVSSSTGSGENDLDFYFDYTCGGCLMTDSTVGPYLFEGAEAGDFTFVMHPVLTSAGAYNTAATAAAIVVAAEDPAKFQAVHEAMIAFALESMLAQETEVLVNLDASKEEVARIATEQGVDESLIASFDTDAAQSYLEASSNNWMTREVEGRDRVASPEFVYRSTKIAAQGDDGEQMYSSLLAAMSELGGN